jgi:hypothetical protein
MAEGSVGLDRGMMGHVVAGEFSGGELLAESPEIPFEGMFEHLVLESGDVPLEEIVLIPIVKAR